MQRLWRAKRRLKYLFASKALILMYHRVTELENDPHLLAVSPKNFAGHMEEIRNHFLPVTLQQVAADLLAGKVSNRTVVITFDDGYADNLYHARPLLEQNEIPAMVFVTTGQVDLQREFWWDELDRLLLQPGTLPTTMRLSVNGSGSEWDLGEASEYTRADFLRYRDWHIEREEDPTIRHRLFRWLFDRLGTLPEGERGKILDDLLVLTGAESSARHTHRTLANDELIDLAKGGLVEVGAHTQTHPLLAAQPVEEQRNEIQQSKERLEAILRHPVTSFAFPHGSYTPETVSVLRATGFTCACTSNPDAVWKGADPLQLPRVGVRNWDPETFATWLRWWLDG